MKKFSIISIVMFFAYIATSTAQIITTVAGNGVGAFTGDNVQATATGLYMPYGTGIDSLGNLYIGDAANNRIRKVTPTGIITTVAGIGTAGYSGDYGPATAAQLNFPYGMAVNPSGMIVIADMSNNRIRSIKTEVGGIIVTIGGTGTAGFSGDGGPATLAQMYNPQGIFWDAYGNVYFGDHFNNRIRKISALGIITTIAGNGTPGYCGDGGPATDACLSAPSGVTMDVDGNLYIADMYNNRIRKINTSGIISTIAGTGTYGYTGDGIAATIAEINHPKDVFIDNMGHVILTDPDNQRLRKIVDGIIYTIAGTGVAGYSGDGGPATLAKLREPQGLFMDGANNIYTGDCLNNRVRKITCIAPTVSSIIGPITDTVCIDSIVIFTNSTSGGVWSSSNTHATISSTGSVTGVSEGYDTISYRVENSCNYAKSVFPFYVKPCVPIGINSKIKVTNKDFVIYPNPTSNTITLELPSRFDFSESEDVTFIVSDVYGRQIDKKITKINKEQKLSYNVTQLSAGTYFVSVIIGKETIRDKFVKW